MNKSKMAKMVGLLAACGLLAVGCETRVYGPGGEAEVEVGGPPPAPLPDVAVGVAPGPDFVWVGGGWGWVGNRWAWQGGHWDHPPRAGMRWAPAHYEYRNGHHVYHRGGWR